MNDQIKHLQQTTINHPLLQQLDTLEHIRIFMSYHVFAVYDYMCLLSGLKNKMYQLYWQPDNSIVSAKRNRLINTLLLEEESDMIDGQIVSHFSLYLQAMKELGCDTLAIEELMAKRNISVINNTAIGEFVSYHLNLAATGSIDELIGAIHYGREAFLSDFFMSIKNILCSHPKARKLLLYLERHIELDAGCHAKLAEDYFASLAQQSPARLQSARSVGHTSLVLRLQLLNAIHEHITCHKQTTIA